jgi:hypothetical protein
MMVAGSELMEEQVRKVLEELGDRENRSTEVFEDYVFVFGRARSAERRQAFDARQCKVSRRVGKKKDSVCFASDPRCAQKPGDPRNQTADDVSLWKLQ